MKRWVHPLSSLLALTGCVFVLLKIEEHSSQLDLSRFDAGVWSGLLFLALAYGASNALLARAWWHLLRHFSLELPWIRALKIYGVSQINKYIPGNVFHLAGRQALGMSAGLPGRPLAQSTLLELVVLATLGLLFGALAMPLAWPAWSTGAAIAFWTMLLAGSVFILYRIGAMSLAVAAGWQAGFLAISGTAFVAVLMISGPVSAVASSWLPAVCGAYVLAWLAGLVAPGAPAGVGVREAVLLLVLGGLFAPADLLAAIVLGRAVTATGDLLFYIYALLLKTPIISHD